jgi:hypothetical protein
MALSFARGDGGVGALLVRGDSRTKGVRSIGWIPSKSLPHDNLLAQGQ